MTVAVTHNWKYIFIGYRYFQPQSGAIDLFNLINITSSRLAYTNQKKSAQIVDAESAYAFCASTPIDLDMHQTQSFLDFSARKPLNINFINQFFYFDAVRIFVLVEFGAGFHWCTRARGV